MAIISESDFRLTVESTNEVVLSEDDEVAQLYVDRTGNLALQTETARRIVMQLVNALNAQHVQSQKMHLEMEENTGVVSVLEQTSADQGKAVRIAQEHIMELQASFGKMSAKLDAFERRLQQDRDTTALENAVRKATESLKDQKEGIRAISVRMDTLDRSVREAVKAMQGDIKEMEENLQEHQSAMEEDMETRLREADESVLSLKLDLEACQMNITETSKAKASRSELEAVNRALIRIMDSVQKDHAVLEEAAGNLGRLEECINMSHENKARCEEISKVFRQEASELREWASRVNAEVRDKIREKMDRGEAEHRLTELQRRLNESVAALAETFARAEHSMNHKASLSLVQRLQHAVEDIKPPSHLARRLFIGTPRCIACDQDIPEAATDPHSVDTLSTKQEHELYQKVQRALGKEGKDAVDVLKYVAVKVGSPRRHGNVELRDDAETGVPGGHVLVTTPTATKPGGAGGAGLGGYNGGGGGHDPAPMPPRAPAREVQPIVRVTPRRPATGGSGHLPSVNTGMFRPQPQPQWSLKQCLGSTR